MATFYAKPYASPVMRARAIVADHARAQADASSEVLRHAERIVQFAQQAPMAAGDLERAHAPWHVFRWVAWDSLVDGCRQRAKLAIHLHEQLAGRRGGWLQERHLTAAFALWEQAREAARKRGGIMPAVDQIPLDDYRRAIETASRRKKRAHAVDEPAPASDGAPELAEVLEPGAASAKREDPPPASAPAQMRVVHLLALAVKTALEVHDLRAAQVANDAILRLAGEPEDDKGELDEGTSEQATSEQATSEQATPEQPAPSAERDTPPDRPTTGDHEAVGAAAPATATAATDTRPLIDILLAR